MRNSKRLEMNIVYFLYAIWVVLSVLIDSLLNADAQISFVLGKTMLVVRLLLIAAAVVSCFLNKSKVSRLLKIAVLTILVVALYLINDSWLLLELFWVPIVWGDDIESDKFLRTTLAAFLASVASVVLIYYSGYFADKIITFYNGRNDIVRNAMGFAHPNSFAEILVGMLFIIWILYYEKNKIKTLILYGIMILFIYFVPNTMSACIKLALVPLFCFILTFFAKRRKESKGFYNCIFTVGIIALVAVFLACVVAVKYPQFDSIIEKLSGTLYSRVELARTGMEKYGITLFGTEYQTATEYDLYVAKTATEYFVIDCLFFMLPIRHGLVFTIFFWCCFVMSFRKMIINKNLTVLPILFAVMVGFAIESYMVTYKFGFLFALAGCKMNEISKTKSKGGISIW